MKRKTFKQCIEENQLAETDIDKIAAKELLHLSEHREQFWQEVNKSDTYPTLYIEGYYEIIKELCTAVLALNGWKATNHECLFAYMIEHRQDLELDYDFLLELKDTRNSIDYRGVRLSPEVWEQNKLKIQIAIDTLKGYVKKQVAT